LKKSAQSITLQYREEFSNKAFDSRERQRVEEEK